MESVDEYDEAPRSFLPSKPTRPSLRPVESLLVKQSRTAKKKSNGIPTSINLDNDIFISSIELDNPKFRYGSLLGNELNRPIFTKSNHKNEIEDLVSFLENDNIAKHNNKAHEADRVPHNKHDLITSAETNFATNVDSSDITIPDISNKVISDMFDFMTKFDERQMISEKELNQRDDKMKALGRQEEMSKNMDLFCRERYEIVDKRPPPTNSNKVVTWKEADDGKTSKPLVSPSIAPLDARLDAPLVAPSAFEPEPIYMYPSNSRMKVNRYALDPTFYPNRPPYLYNGVQHRFHPRPVYRHSMVPIPMDPSWSTYDYPTYNNMYNYTRSNGLLHDPRLDEALFRRYR